MKYGIEALHVELRSTVRGILHKHGLKCRDLQIDIKPSKPPKLGDYTTNTTMQLTAHFREATCH